jgi:uncharacterized protein (TIGR02646 family)
VIRLQRRSAKPPADWKQKVDAALPAGFQRAAVAFEKLPVQGAKRKKGFATYAPHALPLDKKKKKREFPALWQKHPTLKGMISAMSGGYCVYCQSPVAASHRGKVPGHVEHLMPTSRFPTRAYDVLNYFLSCEACNGYKSDQWPHGGYVRPDRGAPEKRFVFGEDGSIKGRAGDIQAKSTVRDLKLDRAGLTDLRRVLIEQHLEFVRRFLEASVDMPAGVQMEALLVRRFSPVSEAINQNVRRVWAQGRRGKRP